MRVFLVRHGLTDWNVRGLVQGHQDIPLNHVGFQQSEKIVRYLSRYPIQKIFSSDLKRCKYTAELLALQTGAKLILTENLRERHSGVWEGLPVHEVNVLAAKERARRKIGEFEFAAEDGENLHQVWERLTPISDALIPSQGNVAIFSHGFTLILLLTRLLGLDIRAGKSFHFTNGAITELRMHHEGHYVLVRYCDESHLTNEELRAKAPVMC
jgi:broad specificity phosphatase PhoE